MKKIIIKNISPNNIFIYNKGLNQNNIQYKLPYIHLTSIILQLKDISILDLQSYYKVFINDNENIHNIFSQIVNKNNGEVTFDFANDNTSEL